MSGDRQTAALGFVAAALALTMWSGTAIATKIAVDYMSGMTSGVLRSLLAGVLAAVIALLFRMPLPSSARELALLAVSGVASFAVWPTLLAMGVARTTATHAAIIMAMIPVFTVLFTHLLERKRPILGWWLGATIAFSATVWLFVAQSSASSSGAHVATLLGDSLVLVGCAVCSLGYIAGGKLSQSIGSMATTFWSLSIALLVLVPTFAFLYSETVWSAVPLRGWLAIGWMTLLSSLAGYGLWFYALSRGGIAKIGSLQLVMPVITVIAAAVILGESITINVGLITLAIVVGTWIAHRNLTP